MQNASAIRNQRYMKTPVETQRGQGGLQWQLSRIIWDLNHFRELFMIKTLKPDLHVVTIIIIVSFTILQL